MQTMKQERLVRLSLRQLQLVATVNRLGSLKRAAETIGMSQPGATKALREAEAILGCPFFHRTNRGMAATLAGQCVIRHADAMLGQLDALEDEMRALSGERWPRLRIGTIMGAVPYVSEVLGRFLQRFPYVSVEMLEESSVELLRLLDAERLDLVVGRSSVSARRELYDVRPFHDERLAVVAHPAHALAGRRRVELDDLAEARWIVYTAAMPMRLSLEQEFRLRGMAFPRDLVETRSALTTITLMQADPAMVALLSSDVAAFFVNFGLARVLPVHLRTKSEPYEVIRLHGLEPSEPVRQFMSDLVAGVPPAAAPR